MQNFHTGGTPPGQNEFTKIREYLTRLVLASDQVIERIDAILADPDLPADKRQDLLVQARHYLAGHIDRPRHFCLGHPPKYGTAYAPSEQVTDSGGGVASVPRNKKQPGKTSPPR